MRREKLVVVFVTIWTSISLKEACVTQLHLTHHTHKVFGVPRVTQGCDHLYHLKKNKKKKKYKESEKVF